MTKRVLFIAGPCGLDVWMWEVFRRWSRDEEIIPHFIATQEKNKDFLLSKGIESKNITTIIPFQNGPTPDLKYLRSCEQKYELNIWDSWSVSSVRNKKRAKLKPEEVLSYFQEVFEKVESIVETVKPEYYVCYAPAGYHSIVIHHVLLKHKVPILEFVAAMLPNRFTFAENLSNIWPTLVNSYHQVKEEGMTGKEKEIAQEYIEDFRNRPNKPDCAKVYKEPLMNKIKRVTSYGSQLIRYRKLPPDLRFFFWPVIQKVYDHIGIFEKPREGEKYVFFPLHFQPESTTLISGKWYVDQATLIENISKAVPISHMLYIKEHPFGYGNRNLGFYRRIKKLPNVRLLSPHEDNFQLIKNCSLLMTITGTSGWEALLFQIPAVTFGNIFYNICEETIPVERINDLPEIIKNNLDRKANKEVIIAFTAALYRCGYEGLTRLPSDCNDHSLKTENISLLVEGIKKHISLLKNKDITSRKVKI